MKKGQAFVAFVLLQQPLPEPTGKQGPQSSWQCPAVLPPFPRSVHFLAAQVHLVLQATESCSHSLVVENCPLGFDALHARAAVGNSA